MNSFDNRLKETIHVEYSNNAITDLKSTFNSVYRESDHEKQSQILILTKTVLFTNSTARDAQN